MYARFAAPRSSAVFALLLFATTLGSASIAAAQACGPAACGTGFQYIDFESLAPGTAVEGPAAIHPDLTITSVAWPFGPTCPLGSTAVIEEGNLFPFVSYGTASAVQNGCLNGVRGFGDDTGCVLDYDFAFPAVAGVSCFSIRMLDFGDLFPFANPTHVVTLTAYDAASTVLDTDVLTMSGAVDLVGGDACVSQAGAPGNYRLVVSGPGIVLVTLRFNDSPDPNVGFDDITFCEAGAPTPALPGSWGGVKAQYR